MRLKKYATSAIALAVLTGGVTPTLANNELNEEVMEKSIKVAKPIINVKNKSIKVGNKFSPLANVTAKDVDGTNLTKHVIVTYNNVDTKKAGVYKVGYAVLGKKGQRTDVEITVTVVGKETVINSTDMILPVGVDSQRIDFKKGVTAIDVTGTNISQHVVIVENNVKTTQAGTYRVKYVVLDTKGKRVYHTRNVIVKEGTTIKAEDRVVNKGDKFNPLENVTAKDITGADLTRYIVVTKNTVDTTKGGVGQVTYVVLDTQGNRVSKTINVKVVGQTEILVGDMEISTGNHDFNPLNHVKAIDVSGLDITQHVIVVKNTVNTYKAGEYEVVFRVLDTEGVIVEKAVKVTVVGEDIVIDEETVKPVIEMIDALPEVNAVKIADKAKVQEVREAYDNAIKGSLNAGVDKYVTNYNKLVELEKKIAKLEAKVDEVKDMLTALPTPEQVTLEHVSAINALSTAYNQLTPEQKKLVAPDEMVIMEYEFVCDRIEKAQPIIKMIDALPNVDEVRAEDAEAVQKVRDAYTNATTGSLNAGVDKYVTNYNKLVELEKKIAELTQP